ncbi:MAG: ABC transporter substrate-binding protein [Eubacteriales bacterium]|nr:ABC transporter substrate-binding protein [Eubacteriales bacterium]
MSKHIFINKLLLLLVICICTGCTSHGSNIDNTAADTEISAPEVVKRDIPCKYDIFDFCSVSDNNFIAADKDTIHIINSTWDEILQIKNNLSLCSLVCYGNGSIYAYDKDDYQIKRFDTEGNLLSIYNVYDIKNIKKFIYTKDKLIFYKPFDSHLIIYSITDNTVYKADIGHVSGISSYKGSKILIYMTDSSNSDKYFCVYDLIKSEITEKFGIDKNVNDFVYSAKDDCIYFFSGGYAYKYEINGASEPIFKSNNNNILFIAVSDNSCYLVDHINKTAYEIDKHGISFDFEGAEKADRISDIRTKLNIISSYRSMEIQPETLKIMEVFSQKYPYVDVRFEYIDPSPKGYPDGEYDTMIRTRLMSSDNGIDIILFNSDAQEETILNADYFIGLENYPSIIKEFENIFPGVRNLCTYRDRLIGVPYSIYHEAWAVDLELLAQIDLECPGSGWTWDDFYEFAKKARLDSDGDGLIDILAFAFRNSVIDPLGASKYCHALYMDTHNRTATYECAGYISFLNILKKIMDENLLAADEKLLSSKKVKTVFTLHRPDVFDGDLHLIAPPSIKGDFKTPVKINMFCINKSSANIDIAVEYLALFLSAKVRLHPDLYPPSYFKNPDYYKGINFKPMRGRELSSDENFILFEHMINNSCIQLRNKDFTSYYGKILDSFSAGEINAEEAARLINNKAKMVLGE